MKKYKHMENNSSDYSFNRDMGKIESMMEIAHQLKRIADNLEKK